MDNQQPQENASQPIAAPIQPTPSNKKLNWKGFLIALAIVGLLDIGALTVIHSENKTQTIKPQSQTKASPTPDPIANWKTFTNNEFHFSFRYPPQFTVTQTIDRNYQIEVNKISQNAISLQYSFSTGKKVDGQPDWSGFSVFIYSTNNQTIEQVFKKPVNDGGQIYTPTLKPLANTGGADEAVIWTDADPLAMRVYRVNNNFISVSHFQNYRLLPDKSDDVMKYYNQILSTIKFIN